MAIPPARTRRGQVVVMVTLALIAMIGMLGLAVDLGWSYFVKKSAQAAADSAAMAAALEAYKTAGPSAPYTGKCGVSLVCAVTPVNCSGSMNLTAGCLYAQQNGFAVGGHGGHRQHPVSRCPLWAQYHYRPRSVWHRGRYLNDRRPRPKLDQNGGLDFHGV
jgi:hypothetical protein